MVRGIGKFLITLGLLIFAFVAYQLWGTGIQHARAQDKLENEFAAQLAAVGDAPVGESATVGVDAPPTTIAGSEPAASSATPGGTTVVPADGATPTTGGPVVPLPPITLGDALGKLKIDKIGVDEIIVAGVRTKDLARGVGHYPYTPLPGNTGNVAIAGHRTTSGQPFFHLEELAAGDEIIIQTLQGTFVYSVTGSQIVAPTDFSVLAGDPGQSTLTLTTCHPRYTTKQRLVVSAVLVPEKSTFAGRERSYDPAAVEASTESASSESEDTIAGGPGVETTAGDATGSTTPAGAVPPTDQQTGSTDGGSLGEPAEQTQDAFSSGWFSDNKAWPDVAAYGAALLAIWLLGKWLGRRTRPWLGPILIAAPFVVLLYFWFENVSRLLPPNL